MRITTSSASQPCFCGDTSHNCRFVNNSSTSLVDAIFCHTYADARKGEKIDGFVCTKEMGTGHTATFVIDNSEEWTEENKRQWQENRERRAEQSKLALKKRIDEQLPAVERDKYYRIILNQLSLIEHDLTSLRMRGMSDFEIKYSLYRSVTPWQKVKGSFPNNLPGLLRGDTLNTAKAGILCPVFNIKGLIVGLKVRKSTILADEGRYFWLTSKTKKNQDGHTPHIDGELPLAVLYPDESKPVNDGCDIAEGVEIKPRILNLRNNSLTCGGGRYWHKSPIQADALISYLKAKGIIKIKLYPDAGDIVNASVWNNWIKEAEFFQSQGFDVLFGYWGQKNKPAKGQKPQCNEECDIDELEDLSCVRFITLADIQAIASEHQPSKQQIIDDINWKNWLKSRLFKAAKKLDKEKFEFPEDIPKHNAIIAIKSGLGTGKTEAILKLIFGTKLGIRLLGYRNNLLFQTIKRGEKYYVVISHINQDGIVEDKKELHLSCCVNSMHKLDGMFEGHDIYIDESVSVLLHLIDGGTFKGYELERARAILEKSFKAANRIFLLDGNQTDDVVDFFSKLDPSKQVVKIENTRKIDPHNIIFCEGGIISDDGEFQLKPKAKSHLIQMIASDDCIPFIATDSKKFAHELAEKLIKAGKCGITISADTVHEFYAREFLENPDLYIRKHKPQFVIITPSCESGVSITEKYFTAKFSFFCGVLGTSSQHQIMFRLRDNLINHYVYCPHQSLIRDHSIPSSCIPKVLLEKLFERIELSSLMALGIANDESAITIIQNSIEAKKDDKWVNLAGKFWALQNFEKMNLRKCLIHSLEEAGHNVSVDQWGMVADIEDEMKEIKEELLDKEAQARFNAVPYESMEEVKEVEKTEHGIDVARRIKKTRMILDILPAIDKEESYGLGFWENCVKVRGYVSGHQNFSRLQNFDVVKKQHESNWFYSSTSEYFYLLGMKDPKNLKIAALHELKILELIQEGREFTKVSPELISRFKQVKDNRQLQVQLGMDKLPKEMENGSHIINFLKQVFNFIGVSLGKAKKKITENGVRLPHYQIDSEAFNDPLRLAIIRITTEKDGHWLQSDKAQIDWTLSKSFDGLVNNLADNYLSIKSHQDARLIESEFHQKQHNSDDKEEANKYRSVIKAAVNVAADKLVQKYKLVTQYHQYAWLNHDLDVTSKMYIGANDSQGIAPILEEIVRLAHHKLEPSELARINDLRPLTPNYMELVDNSIIKARAYPVGYFDKLPVTSKWKFRLETAVSFGKHFVKKIIDDFFITVPMSEDASYMDLFNLYESYSS